jgi:hypothetical protein
MPDIELYRAALDRAVTHAKTYLQNLDAAPVSATVSLAELRSRFSRPLTEDGIDAEP